METRTIADDRLFSPSAARNREAIRAVFLAGMPASGRILEIGSGSGEHAVCLAGALPDVQWTPSDPDAASRKSIAAWTRDEGLNNIGVPRDIDAAKDWDIDDLVPLAGIVSINMIHISPFTAARGLLQGAGRFLAPWGRLLLYGPFSRAGVHTAPSNAAFDADLKSRNPAWGVRDLDLDIAPLAKRAGLELERVAPMPANNFSLIFVKRSA